MKFKKMIASIIALCLPMVETYTPFLTKSETTSMITNAENTSTDFEFDADTIMPGTIKEINTNTTAPYYYEQTNTNTTASYYYEQTNTNTTAPYIPRVVKYASCETEERTYYNTDEAFSVTQIKQANLYLVYEDVNLVYEDVIEIIDFDYSRIGFNGTPASVYNPNNETNKYYIELLYDGEILKDEYGNAVTIVAYIVPYTTTTTTTTTTETTVLPTETTTATTTAQTTSTTTTTSTTIASTVTTVSATTTVTTPIDKNVIWNGSSDTTWYDSEETEFHLYTAEELAGFSDLVNEGRTFEGQTVYLENDIYLNDVSGFDEWKSSPPVNDWNSIGSSSKLLFSGTLDGKNHTVYGMYDTRGIGGFFGYIGEAAVRDFNLSGSYVCISNSDRESYAGGIIGYAVQNVKMNKCSNKGLVISSSSFKEAYAGGLIGCAQEESELFDCINDSLVECSGGKYSVYAGGIIGCGKSLTTFNNCTNNGLITAFSYNSFSQIGSSSIKSSCYSGGLMGYGNIKINECINNGSINSYRSDLSESSGDDSSRLYIRYCSGGMIGAGSGEVADSVNCGKIISYTSSLSTRYRIDGGGSNYSSGGIVGCVEDSIVIENCINNGEIDSTFYSSLYNGVFYFYAGGFVGYEIKSDYYPKENVIYIDNSVNNGKIYSTKKEYADETGCRCFYYSGGVIGNAAAVILKCKNNEMIVSDSISGGIAGATRYNLRIEECINCGNVISNADAGGIVGINNYSLQIKNNYNWGNVDSRMSGGILGYNNGNVKITNVYSIGSISASSRGGGIIGSHDEGTTEDIVRAYYLNTSCSKGIGSDTNLVIDNTIAKNEENMQKDSFASSLGNSFAYVEGNYPKLIWEIEESIVTTTTTSSTTVTTTSTTTATDAVTSSIITTKEALSVNEDEVSLENGSQYTIQSNQENLTYVSNNLSVAVVSKNGVITAIGAGNAVITVMNSDYDVVQIMVTVTEITTVSTTLSTTTTTTETTSITTEPVTETTTTIPPEQSKTYSLGDINGDGVVDASDASQILKIYALLSTSGEVEETEEQLEAADVDKNGAVDASDASTVLTYYAHASTDFKGTFEEYLNARNEETTTIPISTTTTTEITSTTTATTTIVTETTTTPRPSPTVSGKVLTGRMLSGFQSYFYPTGDYDYIEVSWYNSAEKFTYRVGKFDNKTKRITLNMNVATGGPYYLYATPYYEDGTVGEKVTFNVPTTPTNIED